MQKKKLYLLTSGEYDGYTVDAILSGTTHPHVHYADFLKSEQKDFEAFLVQYRDFDRVPFEEVYEMAIPEVVAAEAQRRKEEHERFLREETCATCHGRTSYGRMFTGVDGHPTDPDSGLHYCTCKATL